MVKNPCNITLKFMEQQDKDRLIKLLMKLDLKYSSVRSNILVMQPLPKISLAYKILEQDEKQIQVTNTPTTIQVVYANAIDCNKENT